MCPPYEDPVHGLLDAEAMAWRLKDWEWLIVEFMRHLGLAEARLPSPEDIEWYRFLVLPEELTKLVVDSLSPGFAEEYASLRPGIHLVEAPRLRIWWDYLGPLDKKGKVSPFLWVRRSGLPGGRRSARLKSPDRLRLARTTDPAEPDANEGIWICINAGMEGNKWWWSDVQRATRLLRRLTRRDLDAELASGKRIVKGGPSTHSLWEREWNHHPVLIRNRVAQFPFPELRAVPFYRVEDAPRAFESILRSYVCVSLLEDISDTELGRSKILALARNQRAFPRIERRGRPKRCAAMVMKVRELVAKKGLTKYMAAKQLKMKRPTLYDYLADYEKRRKPVE